MDYSFQARLALADAGFRFSHKLGQNFLLDDDVVSRIADCARVNSGDNVLEIGPGAGTLTAAMAARGANVLAVEIDSALEPVLTRLLGDLPNVRIKFADILKCDLRDLLSSFDGPVNVVANLPYYITTDVLQYLVLSDVIFNSITVMVQKEAAERILATPGSKQYCLLSALLAWHADIEIALELPAAAFTPRPHVDSALVRLTMHPSPYPVHDKSILIQVMKSAFLMRRKTMANNLCSAFNMPRTQANSLLESCGLNPLIRGEALTQSQLAAIANAIAGG